MTETSIDHKEPLQESTPRVVMSVALTPELDAWLEAEAKRHMQGKSSMARLYLAEAYQRAQADSQPHQQ